MTPNQTYNQTIGAEDRALLRSIPSARRSESTDVCRPGSRSGFRAQASQSAFGPKRKTSGFGAAPQVSDLSNVTNVNIYRGYLEIAPKQIRKTNPTGFRSSSILTSFRSPPSGFYENPSHPFSTGHCL